MSFTTSYWPADTSEQVQETTVGGLLREAAAHAPDHIALVASYADVADRRRWTYAQLLAESEVAASLGLHASTRRNRQGPGVTRPPNNPSQARSHR